MATFTHASRVDAPFENVWEFHSTGDGLVALTPGFANLRVEATRGPDGESDPDELVEGTEIDVSMRPFGVGPRQRWTSRIVERERGHEEGFFVDEMVEGPFAHWRHTHRFDAEGEGTLMQDRVEWALPGGAAGRLAAHLGIVGLEPAFRYRHRRARKLLETPADASASASQ
jgi:ligand-binding SRPBCC domain-containing protein